MPYRLVDPRPATLGDNGISVWTESGAEIRLKVPGQFYVVQDEEGKTWLAFEKFHLQVSKSRGLEISNPYNWERWWDGHYFLRVSKNTRFLVYPMLRMASLKKALGQPSPFFGLKTPGEILRVVDKGLSAQFDVYSWENMIDDCGLSAAEASWAKRHIGYKAYIAQAARVWMKTERLSPVTTATA